MDIGLKISAMLHIHNGDSSADTAKQSSLAGEHFAFRESLITGPTPSGLSGDEWRRVRAAHLSESYGVDEGECEQGLLRQEEKLASFSEHDEVVLWFEHDLFASYICFTCSIGFRSATWERQS